MTTVLVSTPPSLPLMAAPADGASPSSDGGAFGSAVASEPILPSGPAYPSFIERPRDEKVRPPACSFALPLCVHAGSEVAPDVVLGTLADLEHAAARLSFGVNLPRPLADGSMGGSPAFDLYLVAPDSVALAGAPVMTARDDPSPGSFDRASAFGIMRRDSPSGCVRRNLAGRTYASAAQWGIDAGEAAIVRESNAAYLAELVEPCGVIATELVDDFQAHPERGFFAWEGAGAPAMLVPWYVDLALGGGTPGGLPIALAVIGGQRTPAGGLSWINEPDWLDTMRGVLKARTPAVKVDDLWLDWAVARLFAGARDDGAHFSESAFTGSFGRVRFDWSVSYESLPRRVTPERPIEPTGSTYVWVDLRGAPAATHLAFRMEWEAPVLFRWALVRIRADGSEASRVVVAPRQRSTSADQNLDDLDGLAGVAVVGTNIGDLRLDDPFDPDIAPYEPHGYVLTIAR